ncbi:MAG TPA: EAL domain-containing protein [Candidatus Acidoferrales bacterium]|jgi:diguanylate cyclase (GGDEF)-like protein|nr:EAL domain-containing protein [Candidatus Acidoferrales bacterium]
MNGNRQKLRLLYLALCVSQLVVTGLGLAVAYQVHRSYSQNIDYESSVNAEHRAVSELQSLAHVASPESVELDDDSSGASQFPQIAYSSTIFLRKVRKLRDEADSNPHSPLVRSRDDLAVLDSQMTMVAQQSQLAEQALDRHNMAELRAHLTYADRAATRVQTVLGDISQQMYSAKDDVLARESREASHTSFVLAPISIAGILLVLPALLYARRLDRNVWGYEAQLETERKLLEERVFSRTSELRLEIESRKAMEAFNVSRNRLLEKVVEDKNLDEVLMELADATERSVRESKCLILLGGRTRSAIAPNVQPNLAVFLERELLRRWDSLSAADAQDRSFVFVRHLDVDASVDFAEVWAGGFRGILAVPITEPGQSRLGVIMLLLRDHQEPGKFAREVLLSASRMASVALEHGRMQNELFRQAHHDPLTDLPNRVLFEDRLQQSVARAARRKASVGVLCIDLDGFKQVNDQYGHQMGDWLLQQVAGRLTTHLRSTDTIARVGGDEFIAVLDDVRDVDSVAKVGESFVRLLWEPFTCGNIVLRTTASIGAAIFPMDGTSTSELQRHADLAMYRAKERGRNTYQMFSAELGEKLARRRQVERYLQEALEGEGFELCYQPIYTMSRTLVGLEALVRFRQAELKHISPAEFILVAEQTGQISYIGEWVLREACRQTREWQKCGLAPVPIAVNVSAIQLGRPDFASHVAQILRETDLAPAWLQIEVTETAIMNDFEEGGRQVYALAELGVRISIDDFGTGHSSLSYIHRLPIGTLKIDRSFVQQMVDSQESRAIVRAIIAMAKSLELRVVAEGVETEDQLDALARAGCEVAQGYFFARPLDQSSVSALFSPGATVPAPDAEYTTQI